MHFTTISVFFFFLITCSRVHAVPVQDLELESLVSQASLMDFLGSSAPAQTSTPKVHEPVASPATTASPSPDATPKLEKRGIFHTMLGPPTNQSQAGVCGGVYHAWPGRQCQWKYPSEQGRGVFDPNNPPPPTVTVPDDDITDVTKEHHDPIDPCNESRVYSTTGLDLYGNFQSHRYDVSERYLCCRLCHESELNCVASFFDELDSKCTIFINNSSALPINFRHEETHILRKNEQCPLGIFDIGKAYRRKKPCPAGTSIVDHGTGTDSVRDCEGYMLGPCWTPFRDDFPFSKQGETPGYVPYAPNLNDKLMDEENPYGFDYGDPFNPSPNHHNDKYANKDDYHSEGDYDMRTHKRLPQNSEGFLTSPYNP